MTGGDGRVALVTGASSGIGAAIAARLVRDGYRVFGTSRRGTGPARDVEWLALDVNDDASVAACARELLSRTGGRLDVLVNNAGYLVSGAVEEVSLEDARAQLETNYFGVVRVVRAFLPTLRTQRSGRIITISSLAGLVPLPFWGHYNASKMAVEGLMEALAHELLPFGVQVACVEPGAIKTAFYEKPKAAAIDAYAPWRTRFEATMARFEREAPGPERVADVVSHVARATRPALRNTVTREAVLFPFLRWLLPARWFAIGLRKGFALDG